jgi:hypothetical protein
VQGGLGIGGAESDVGVGEHDRGVREHGGV